MMAAGRRERTITLSAREMASEKIVCYKKRGFLLISDDLSDIIANL